MDPRFRFSHIIEYTLFEYEKLWGLRDQNGVQILSPNNREISVFNFLDGQLVGLLESTMVSSRNRRNRITNLMTNMTKISLNPESEVIFLVKREFETFLLKRAYNRLNHRTGNFNIYKEYDTLEEFKLNMKLRKSNKKTLDDRTLHLGTYYDDIMHIGHGFFKVKLVDVYQDLEPIDDNENYAWHLRTNDISWKVIDYNGDAISKYFFSNVNEFVDGICSVTIKDESHWLKQTGELAKVV